MRQLGMGHLKLARLAAQPGIVLAPVELESFAGLEHQWHECPAPTGLLFLLPLSTPLSGKGSYLSIIDSLDELLDQHRLACMRGI